MSYVASNNSGRESSAKALIKLKPKGSMICTTISFDNHYIHATSRALYQEQTYNCNLNRANDVHSAGDGGGQVEEETDGAPKLGTQGSTDHKVGAAPGYHPVCGNGSHGDGSQHGLKKRYYVKNAYYLTKPKPIFMKYKVLFKE